MLSSQTAARFLSEVDNILGGKTAQEIFESFVKAVKPLGFDKIVMGQAFVMSDMSKTPRRFFFHHGVTDFLKIYAQKNYQFSDPVTLRIMTTRRPFRWREANVDMTAAQLEQLNVARSFGHNFGIVFPVIDPSGATGFVSLGRETDFDLQGRQFLELELLCRYSYMAIDSFYKPAETDEKISLNPRETAILMHVSRGKTNWETGQILGLSEYSVRDYLKSLSARLETSNRTHTVVRAIQLGLILP